MVRNIAWPFASFLSYFLPFTDCHPKNWAVGLLSGWESASAQLGKTEHWKVLAIHQIHWIKCFQLWNGCDNYWWMEAKKVTSEVRGKSQQDLKWFSWVSSLVFRPRSIVAPLFPGLHCLWTSAVLALSFDLKTITGSMRLRTAWLQQENIPNPKEVEGRVVNITLYRYLCP